MKQKDTQFELIRRCLDNEATDDDFIELETLLREDAGFRRDYVRYLNVDSGLRVLPKEPEAESSNVVSQPLQFWQWRPLVTSAAAGVALGLFCASVAWAIVVPRDASERLILPVLSESFEEPATTIIDRFPTSTEAWGGDRSRIVGDVAEHQAADGNAMLSLESGKDSNLGYLQRIIDVSVLPLAREGEMRTLDVVASFLADQPGEQERYTLRIATFKESPSEIGDLWEGVAWRDMDGNTLTMAKSALSTPGTEEGWQTVSAVVDVPESARSLVISLAAGRLNVKAPKSPHYIDDVRANLVIAPLSKRKPK